MRVRGVVCSTLALLLTGVASAAAVVQPPVPVTDASTFPRDCNGAPQSGRVYRDSEVEPWVAVDPSRPRSLIGVWQQDRWSTGGANGLATAFSQDGGVTWSRAVSPPFSRCAGGNARNGGDYERASDPWVSVGADGLAYQVSLSFNDSNPTNAVLASTSRDGGRTWLRPATLIRDTDVRYFNDKESVTADPTRPGFAYAVWDHLDAPPDSPTYTGPTWFARTTNGGLTWERARSIFEPGTNNQTLANQIAVLPDGALLDVFALLLDNGAGTAVAVIRSTDQGATWSGPTIVDALGSVGVVDPRDGAPVRTGDILPDVAVDPGSSAVYVVWQDARFTGSQRDQCALSRSRDGGRTWSPARVVSENLATQAFTCSVDVDRGGAVGVSYYDFTSDTPATPTLDTDYWFARSRNGGRSFAPRERVTPASFDMSAAPVAGGFFVGDYEGLAGVRGTFVPFAAFATPDAFIGPTDVFAAVARAPFPPGTSPTATAASVAAKHQALTAGTRQRTVPLRRY